MNDPQLFLSFYATHRFYPDRVRSFLEYLKGFSGPLQIGGFPANLYVASEKLVSESGHLNPSPFLQRTDGEKYPLKLEVRNERGLHIFAIAIAPASEAAALFTSSRFLELLSTGARMTGACCAAVSIEPEANAIVQVRIENEILRLRIPPLALWISAPLASELGDRPEGYADHVDWDGAVLLLHPSVVDEHSLRQAIRWMIHDRVVPNDGVVKVFGDALANADWELRASAMLGIARLGLYSLGLNLRRAELPDTSREGLVPGDRRILRAMRQAVLQLLTGEQLPPQSEENPNTEAGMRAHLLRCVAGLPVAFHDDIFLLTNALTEPLPITFPRPESLPDGLEETEHGVFRSLRSGIEFVWIPPIAHWLGEGQSIRQVSPKVGFFLSKWPVQTPAGSYCCGTWEDAQRICRELSATEAINLTLPKADEWEMAARGPDGRRFSWGNGFERNMLRRRSPWGLGDCLGVIGQWTQDGWICGRKEDLRCSARDVHDSLAAVRLKIDS